VNDLRLSDALRYGLPGGVLLLVAAATYPQLGLAARADGGLFEATIIAGTALVVGAVIQALHRALAYPVIYRWFLVRYEEDRAPKFRDLKSAYMPSAIEISVTEQRWQHAAANQQTADRLADWGSQTHFLYGAAWAIVGGLVLPAVAGFNPNGRIGTVAVGLGILLVSGAFIHDRRLMLIDKAITRGQQQKRGA
jgi:hypothetical protein